MKGAARIAAGARFGALLMAASLAAGAAEEPAAGMQILGDRDSALGLVLAPWQDERPHGPIPSPAVQDPTLQPLDADAFARTQTYHQMGRAYRAERLQRNR